MIEVLINSLKITLRKAMGQYISVEQIFQGTQEYDRVYLIKTTLGDYQSSMTTLMKWFLAHHPNLVYTFWDQHAGGSLALIDYSDPSGEKLMLEGEGGQTVGDATHHYRGFMFHLTNLPMILHALDHVNEEMDQKIKIGFLNKTQKSCLIHRREGSIDIGISLSETEKNQMLSLGFGVGCLYLKVVKSVGTENIKLLEDGSANASQNQLVVHNHYKIPASELVFGKFSSNVFTSDKSVLRETDKGGLVALESNIRFDSNVCVRIDFIPVLFKYLSIKEVPVYAKFSQLLNDLPQKQNVDGVKWMMQQQHPYNRKTRFIPSGLGTGSTEKSHHILWDPVKVTTEQAVETLAQSVSADKAKL